MSNRLRRHARGATLLELLFAFAVMMLIFTITIPQLVAMMRRRSVFGDAAHLRYTLRMAQVTAGDLTANVAVRFTFDGQRWQYAVYVDGNGNGVSNADILHGIDRPLQPPRDLLEAGSLAQVGFLPGATDPDSLKPIAPGTSAVEFNASQLCSFASDGSATPGTLYLTDGIAVMVAVRSSGASGKLSTLLYNGPGHSWTEQ